MSGDLNAELFWGTREGWLLAGFNAWAEYNGDSFDEEGNFLFRSLSLTPCPKGLFILMVLWFPKIYLKKQEIIQTF